MSTTDTKQPPGVPISPAPDYLTTERSDAARHRAAILDAATALVAETGPGGVTMDAVARRAGVGKGTVFRRFGSRAGLMLALLDRSERDLQLAALFGPPPLGPGADPVDRLVAYGRARLELVVSQGELLHAAGADFLGSGAYTAAIWHVRVLLRQSGFCGDDLVTAQQILAGLSAPLVNHQHLHLSLSGDRIADAFESTIRRITA